MKFLVVDDNRLLCRVLTTFLREKGHSAISQHNPVEARSHFETDGHKYDAVIMDIALGSSTIDGFELTKEFREKNPEVVIVIFTGLGYDENAIAKAREAGADGYVSKGLGPAEIYNAVMRLHAEAHPHHA